MHQLRITILCENTVGRPGRLIGEHGFAALVETPAGNLLFDTGQGVGLLNNAAELGIDLTSAAAVVLSHGHYDHGGGLLELLKALGPHPIYAHPEVFAERYWASPYQQRAIGLPETRAAYEAAGARFELDRHWRQLLPGVWLSGEVPRCTAFEPGDPHLVVPASGGFDPDPLRDDQSLVIETRRGLVVLAGCAHAGLVNILQHVQQQTGRSDIHAVLGGTHLNAAGEAQLEQTMTALDALPLERLGLCHCTGPNRVLALARSNPQRLLFTPVGSQFEV